MSIGDLREPLGCPSERALRSIDYTTYAISPPAALREIMFQSLTALCALYAGDSLQYSAGLYWGLSGIYIAVAIDGRGAGEVNRVVCDESLPQCLYSVEYG